MKSQKITGFVIVVMIIIVSAFLSFWFYQNNIQKQNEQKIAQIWEKSIQEINNLHSNIRNLRTNVSTKNDIIQELSILKTNAENTSKNLAELKMQAMLIRNQNIGLLVEALNKMQKYAEGYSQIANVSTNEKGLQSKASAMISSTDALKAKGNFFGAPDQGDVNDSIVVVSKIVKKLNEANKPPIIQLKTSSTKNEEEINPEYNEYYAKVREILRNYQKGRNTLSAIMKNYDMGIMSQTDIQKWNQEN